MKIFTRALALLLVAVMLCTALLACKKDEEGDDEDLTPPQDYETFVQNLIDAGYEVDCSDDADALFIMLGYEGVSAAVEGYLRMGENEEMIYAFFFDTEGNAEACYEDVKDLEEFKGEGITVERSGKMVYIGTADAIKSAATGKSDVKEEAKADMPTDPDEFYQMLIDEGYEADMIKGAELEEEDFDWAGLVAALEAMNDEGYIVAFFFDTAANAKTAYDESTTEEMVEMWEDMMGGDVEIVLNDTMFYLVAQDDEGTQNGGVSAFDPENVVLPADIDELNENMEKAGYEYRMITDSDQLATSGLSGVTKVVMCFPEVGMTEMLAFYYFEDISYIESQSDRLRDMAEESEQMLGKTVYYSVDEEECRVCFATEDGLYAAVTGQSNASGGSSGSKDEEVLRPSPNPVAPGQDSEMEPDPQL